MVKKLYFCYWFSANNKLKIMLVISAKEFRDKQRRYLDKVDEGTEILIQRKKNKSYKIIPVTDDTLLGKEEYISRLKRGFQSIKEGKGKEYTLKEIDELFGL
jgi:PHD/YefM family antitoxin component YafN of YafNO toxin-antitoxin module